MTKLMNAEIEALLKAGIYKNKSELLNEAFRNLLEMRPELKVESAIELYKEGKISLARFSEIAGISIEAAKGILLTRGIKRMVKTPSGKTIREAERLVLGNKR